VGDRSTGVVYVFERLEDQWVLQQKILPPDPPNSSGFGHAVAIDGDRIAVGAPHTNVNGIGGGAAYVYLKSGSPWSLESQLIEPLTNAADQYGFSVDLHDGKAVVGAPFMDPKPGFGTGGASVFAFDGTNWNRENCLRE